MTPIPRAALILGLAGLIPFGWSVATLLSPTLADLGQSWLGPRFIGPYVGLQYGTIILAFMSGVLWGFATTGDGRTAALGYGLSVIPALWAFFFVGGGPETATLTLSAGFGLLLGLDWLFWTYGLAPAWWMRLRVLLTGIVLMTLLAPLMLGGIG